MFQLSALIHNICEKIPLSQMWEGLLREVYSRAHF